VKQALTWRTGGRYAQAQAGHLHCYVEHVEAYKEPGHPDHAPESFAWFVAPDDEDKNYRRAIREGRAGTRDGALAAVEEALFEIACGVLRATGARLEDVARGLSS